MDKFIRKFSDYRCFTANRYLFTLCVIVFFNSYVSGEVIVKEINSNNKIKLAEKYVGILDNSDSVKVWLKEVGINTKAPWCASFISHLWYITNDTSIKRSGSCYNIFSNTKGTITTNTNITGGSLLIWQYTNRARRGHIGMFVKYRNRKGAILTIEGNTTNNNKRGVFYKQRNLYKPLTKDCLLYGIIKIKECD